jgi:hypothetical protein
VAERLLITVTASTASLRKDSILLELAVVIETSSFSPFPSHFVLSSPYSLSWILSLSSSVPISHLISMSAFLMHRHVGGLNGD